MVRVVMIVEIFKVSVSSAHPKASYTSACKHIANKKGNGNKSIKKKLNNMNNSHKCPYCPAKLATAHGLHLHIMQTKRCLAKMQASLYNSESDENRAIENTSPTTETLDEENAAETMYTDDENDDYTPVPEGANPPLEYAAIPGGAAVDMLIDLASPSASQRGTVEDVEVFRDGYWIETFPKPAGTKKGKALSQFEKLREMQKEEGDKPWVPFESEEEWELARWMMTSGTSRKKMDALLKLDMVRISQHQTFNIKLTKK